MALTASTQARVADVACAAARRSSNLGVSPSKPTIVLRSAKALAGSSGAHVRGTRQVVPPPREQARTFDTRRELSVEAVQDKNFVSFRTRRVKLPQQNTQKFSSNDDSTVNVLGLGQAMVDFAAVVEPEVVDSMSELVPDLEYGGRACVDAETRGKVLTKLDGQSYKLSAGGSLSNTLVALSRMGAAAAEGREGAVPRDIYVNKEGEEVEEKHVDVSIACSLGPDPLGDFYRTKVKKSGVRVLSKPGPDGTTGSVIVLTTPDAQRTMLSCWGTSATLDYDDDLDEAVAQADVLVVEGYLWEMPETIASIRRALHTAKRTGVLVALTASDASCVEKHGDEFWELLRAGDVDCFFANEAEARAMTGLPEGRSTREAVVALAAHAKLVAVTDGSKGSYLMQGEEFAHIPPHWLPSPPVDTCGAGDAYAAGCLYGLLHGADIHAVGRMGARVASVVISIAGARLSTKDAEMLMREDLFRQRTSKDVPKAGQPLPAAPLGDWDELNQRISNLKKKGGQ